MTFKQTRIPYIIYLSMLSLLYIGSFFFDPRADVTWLFFKMMIILLVFCLIFIVWVAIEENKKNSSKILMKLSRLPLLVIASHIPLILIGRPFTDQGGWWVLYALIVICLPLSLVHIGSICNRVDTPMIIIWVASYRTKIYLSLNPPSGLAPC